MIYLSHININKYLFACNGSLILELCYCLLKAVVMIKTSETRCNHFSLCLTASLTQGKSKQYQAGPETYDLTIIQTTLRLRRSIAEQGGHKDAEVCLISTSATLLSAPLASIWHKKVKTRLTQIMKHFELKLLTAPFVLLNYKQQKNVSCKTTKQCLMYSKIL